MNDPEHTTHPETLARLLQAMELIELLVNRLQEIEQRLAAVETKLKHLEA